MNAEPRDGSRVVYSCSVPAIAGDPGRQGRLSLPERNVAPLRFPRRADGARFRFAAAQSGLTAGDRTRPAQKKKPGAPHLSAPVRAVAETRSAVPRAGARKLTPATDSSFLPIYLLARCVERLQPFPLLGSSLGALGPGSDGAVPNSEACSSSRSSCSRSSCSSLSDSRRISASRSSCPGTVGSAQAALILDFSASRIWSDSRRR